MKGKVRCAIGLRHNEPWSRVNIIKVPKIKFANEHRNYNSNPKFQVQWPKMRGYPLVITLIDFFDIKHGMLYV